MSASLIFKNFKSILCFFIAMFVSFAEGSSIQNLDLEKIYMKWTVGGKSEIKNDKNLCWILEDKIIEGDAVPLMWGGEEGASIALELQIRRTSPDCKILKVNSSQEWKMKELSSELVGLELNVRLPFSSFQFKDNEGTSLELLVEGRIVEIERVDFFNFFKKSIFSARMMAINYQVWQLPFLRVQYELPQVYFDWLYFQIALGQSLFDFTSNRYRQGAFGLALGVPILGSNVPYQGPYTIRLKGEVEGRQINDQNDRRLYPFLASQSFGGGVEFYSALNNRWGLQSTFNYLISQPVNAKVNKMKYDFALNYAFNPRWRVEAGVELNSQKVIQFTSTQQFTEKTFFVGIFVKPYGI